LQKCQPNEKLQFADSNYLQDKLSAIKLIIGVMKGVFDGMD
jgi:hypothetical protein